MSLEYHYKEEDLTYRIEFVTKKNKNISNIFIEIYGKPYKEWLLDLTGNYHLPLLSKQIIQKKIMWGVKDNQWVPDEVRDYCDRVVKNMAFL